MPCRRIISIGRDTGSDYRLDSTAASSDHALLIVGEGSQHLLIDHDSMNGTRVAGVDGGSRIRQRMVGSHEEVFFADVRCLVGDILSRVGITD